MLSHSHRQMAVRGMLAVAMSLGLASSARADHTRSTCGVTVSVGTPTLSLSYSTVPRVTRIYTSSSYHPYVYSATPVYTTVPATTTTAVYATPTVYRATPVVSSYRTSGYRTGYIVMPKVVVPTTQHSHHRVVRSRTSRIYSTSSRIYPTSSRIYPTSSRIYSTSSRIYPTTGIYYHRTLHSTPRISVVSGSSRVVRIPTHTHGVSVSGFRYSLHRSGH